MRQEKHLLLDEVKGHIDTSKGSFVIIGYRGLEANKANEFRRAIRKVGGNVEVMRKRILIKAAEAAGITLNVGELPGHIGLVLVGQDAIETTKIIFQFGKENENKVDVVGGRFDGKLYPASDVEKMSKLPSRDEMRAQFLGLLEAPMAQTLATMEAIMTSVIYCLDNKSKDQA